MSGEPRPLLLTGGTGLLGGHLRSRLEGRPLRLLSRKPERVRTREAEHVHGWDGRRADWSHVSGCGAVVHLSGEPLFGPPSRARLERVRRSRLDSTRSLVEAMGALAEGERPEVFVCASATGYYGDRGEEVLEEGAPPGEGFLADLCRDWEAEAARAGELGVRVVSVRTGVVLAREGGALALMAPIFRLGLGGALGDGRQWLAWIHVDDETALLQRAVDDPALSGPVNGTAPEAARNEEFTRALASLLNRPAFLRVPAFALRLGLRDVSRELLDSRRVRPAKAEAAGFAFAHPHLRSALQAGLG